ncbi:MAG: PBP1A family penicillin-binding protein [Candidatus Binatia bacterium]
MLRRVLIGACLLCVAGVAAASVTLWVALKRLEPSVLERFRTHRWALPSKIYSDSLLIYPGMDLQAVGFFERLRDLDYRRVEGGVSHQGEFAIGKNNAFVDLYLHEFPHPTVTGSGARVRLNLSNNAVVSIEDLVTQKQAYALELDRELISGLYQGNWEERHLVRLDEVPPLLLRAIIDVEDQRFYEHHGIDVSGIVRALWVDLRSGRVEQGGSTLTQQLMKNFFLTDERSVKRKVSEALMALIVERHFSKQEILTNYINEIYLGQKGAQGIYGVWEASQFYFGKNVQDLSVAEIATLAGLIKAPNRYSPFRNPGISKRRRDYALLLMEKQGDLTEEEYAAAAQQPLLTVPPENETNDAPYFTDFVRHELSQTYPAQVLTSEGLQILTSLDMHLQRLAEHALEKGLTELEKRHPKLRTEKPADALQGCLIVIQPQTGAIKAMVGGRDYRNTQFNRCTQALRQPGSVFKPFTYLAAFEETRHSAQPILPTTRIADEPFAWAYDHQVWTPANYKKRYFGEVTVREALEHSLNAATARLAHEVGIEPIIETAHRLGITSPLPPYPSVVLGAAEVTPFEVAQAFTALANSGLRTTLLAIKKVLDNAGQPIERNPVQVEQVIPADTAYLVTHLMEGVLNYGTAAAARTQGFKRPAAGKTGTTNDFSDAWFAGFTPDLLAVVWVGYDQRRPLNMAGAEAALPIWTDFMKAATAGIPPNPLTPPPGITTAVIDPASGMLATPLCPKTLEEAFYSGTEPTAPCPLHPVPGAAENLSGTTAPDTERMPRHQPVGVATMEDGPATSAAVPPGV